jgi:phage baseplate assembly protein W
MGNPKIDGRENLAQALMLRLLTPRGVLMALGHAQYGSRLHELIGRNKTEALRNLCRAFILEVVAQEPRVEDQAVEITFHPDEETSASFVFTLAVKPRTGDAPIGLTLEVGL